MFAIFKKEISFFFSSLIGPIILIIFLFANSIFLWMYETSPGLNIPNSGFASLHPLFYLAPRMYLFLIPAMTMRTFSEEHANGTMELMLTKPLSELQIIIGKYIACFVILILTLIPTLVYYYSVYWMGDEIGNIDHGQTIGSYIGLLLLGAAFIAIGIFASSLAKNQIISLLISVAMCANMYMGIGLIASVLPTNMSYFFENFGIETHYYSISRGLIELKDVMYYFCLIAFFVLATRTVLILKKR